MKRKVRFSHRSILPVLVAAATVLTACGGNLEKGTTVSVGRDGKINSHIVTEFDKSYYDKDELQQRILEEVLAYNRESGADGVSVEKIDVKDSLAVVDMSYAGGQDYAGFNHSVFFVGNAFKAQAEGYDLNTVLSGTEDAMDTVGMSDILAMTDYTLLITDMKDSVSLSGETAYVSIALEGRAAYVSDNVIVGKNLKTVSLDEESEELAYILFK